MQSAKCKIVESAKPTIGILIVGPRSPALPGAEEAGDKRVPWSADEAAAPSATKMPGTTNGQLPTSTRLWDDRRCELRGVEAPPPTERNRKTRQIAVFIWKL